MVLQIINIIALILIAIGYFKLRYIIVELETWNTVANYYNDHHNEDGEELVGGLGFFKEQLIDDEEEYEEENEWRYTRIFN